MTLRRIWSSARLTAATAVVSLLLVGATAAPSAAQETAYAVVPDAEAEFLGYINDLRSAQGLAALQVDQELVAIARSWARTMAEAGRISHNPNFADQVSADWLKLGENVGMGAAVRDIHDAFVRSSVHYRNLVSPDYTFIGVGVVQGPDGILYTAHQFMQLRPAAAPSPTPTASPTGATSAAATVPAQHAMPASGEAAPVDVRLPLAMPRPQDVLPVASGPLDHLAAGDRWASTGSPPTGVPAAATGRADLADPVRLGGAVGLAVGLLVTALALERRRRRGRRRPMSEVGVPEAHPPAARHAAATSLAGWTTGLHWQPAANGDRHCAGTPLSARLAAYSATRRPERAQAKEARGEPSAHTGPTGDAALRPTALESPAPAASRLWVQLTGDGAMSRVSDTLAAALGYTAPELHGRPVADLVHPADQHAVAAASTHEASSGSPTGIVGRFRHRDGSWRHLEITGTSDADDHRYLWVTDITERTAVEAALRHHAYHDRATGLPDRAALGSWFAASATVPGAIAVVLVHLGDLEVVRENFGHAAAEHLLLAVAERLRSGAAEGDLVARAAEADFVLARRGALDERDAIGWAAEVVAAARRPLAVMDQAKGASCAGGVAWCGQRGLDADELVRRAYVAMRAARRRGETCVLYQPDLSTAAAPVIDLGTAGAQFSTQQLVLHYQPIIDLRTGEVAGLEALVRWHQPGRGLLGPGEFLPRAEAGGHRADVADWVLSEACRTLAHPDVRSAAPVHPYVSVNVGARDLADARILEQVDTALGRVHADPARLVIEITEAEMLGEEPQTANTLRALKDAGVRLAVDDFGMGFSTLSNLKRIPADILKIDRSLVGDLGQGAADPIVTAVVGLARTLGLTTVAEGVERGEQLDELREAGCDCVQGYLCAPPLPLGTATELIRSTRTPVGTAASQPNQ